MHPNILSHGSLNSIVKPVMLNAGDLSVAYQNGFLRYIKLGDVEVVRMINHAVRNHNWGTVPFTIDKENIQANNTSFFIEYEAQCQQGDIDFVWQSSIRGNEDGTIIFSIAGKANTSFLRNRIGFTVLHPIDTCSGKECVITHSDSKIEFQPFPEFINPNQPFCDVVAMEWKPDEHIQAVLHFEGDVFETEDQRNWIDASYKTYCTPLSKPFPVKVEVGDKIKQMITLQVHTTERVVDKEEKPLSFQLDRDTKLPFPKIGTPINTISHDDYSLQLLKTLQLDFLRVEVVVQDSVNSADLQHAAEICFKAKCSLEVILFFDENYDVNFVNHLLPFKDVIIQFIVLPSYAKCTDQHLVDQIVPHLRKYFPQTKIGGGTDAFFAELNRKRTPVQELDFLTFSTNPQVHAFDLNSLTENLAAHRYAVDSCRVFTHDKKVHVGPVTFKMRWNPNASSVLTEKYAIGEVPSYVDPRQLSLYGAAWMLGSFKYLAEGNASAITFFQTCGWVGLMPHANEQWPKEYSVNAKSVYPIYIVLMELLQHKNKWIVPLLSSDPLLLDGIGIVDHHGNETVMLFNYTDRRQHVELSAIGNLSKVKILDTGCIESFMEDPSTFINQVPVKLDGEVSLNPFSIAFIN